MTDHAAQRVHYEAQAAIAEYPRVVELLREARAALGPEFCGYAGSLAGRIDDALHGAICGQALPVASNAGERPGDSELLGARERNKPEAGTRAGRLPALSLADPADLVFESYDGGDSFGWFRK